MTARQAIAESVTVSRRPEYVPDLPFHAARHRSAPAHDGAVTLAVGGISVRLFGLEADRVETLRARYGIFSRAQAPSPDLEIKVSSSELPRFLEVQDRGEHYRVDTRWEADTLLACSYEWAGWMDAGRREGGLTLAQEALTSPRGFDRSLENFLRVVFSHLIVPRGGFLLHSAGLVRDGRAHMFFGPSGSGKTTVTTLTPEATILSDDLTMVVRDAGGSYRACSVPFRGLFAPEATSDATWPIAAFYRLIQDTEDRLERVQGARAVGELVGSLPFVTDRTEIAGLVMDTVAKAAATVPIFRLHFKKDRTFWQAIDPNVLGVDGFSAPAGIKA